MPDWSDRLRALPVLTAVPPLWDPALAPDCPEVLFSAWLDAAITSGAPEPHAMTLSTTDAQGPDARVLILKDLSDGTWWFASTAMSAKGRQLESAPTAALTFYWPSQARQIRIRGPVVTRDGAVDFKARGPGAQAIALLARESDDLPDPAALQPLIASSRARLEADPSLVAKAWTLYGVRPRSVEFWQAGPDRAHLRLTYRTTDFGWERVRLYP